MTQSEQPKDSKIVLMRDLATGEMREHLFTTIPKPDGADLLRYCYNCKKWTWLIGHFCSECGGRNA